MKRSYACIALALFAVVMLTKEVSAVRWTANMTEGKPAFRSMGSMAFGPEGILFIADAKSAAIVAIATGDVTPVSATKMVKVEGINQKIAALLGTTADQILIDDLAVNPKSRLTYLSVSRGRGPEAVPVLVRVKADGQPEVVSLEKVKFSRVELPDAPADGVISQGNRQSNPRLESITDIAFLDGRVLVAGLSNEEFASTLRAVPFPFQNVSNGTSIEIYHGSHGKFETRAPVRTFAPYKIGGEMQLLAAYTCTPLVQFSLKELTPGAKIKGKTIAELGNRNRPLDMVVYQKDGQNYLLMANNNRGVMKINAEKIAEAESIVAPVPDKKGLAYETIETLTGVDQLDLVDGKHIVVLRKGEGGALTLEVLPIP